MNATFLRLAPTPTAWEGVRVRNVDRTHAVGVAAKRRTSDRVESIVALGAEVVVSRRTANPRYPKCDPDGFCHGPFGSSLRHTSFANSDRLRSSFLT